MKTKVYMRCLFHVVIAGMIYLLFSSNVAMKPGDIQPRDVLSNSTYTYTGWVDNPETLSVYIDDTFSEQEKDSVRVAIQRWNDAGCVPALSEVDEGPASVTVIKGDPGVDPETGTPNAGLYNWSVDDDGKMHGGVITIRDNPNPGLVETATHELGHALGLDDTDPDDNPDDVMKGSGPSNGTNGELSEHDLSELEAAAAAITPIGEETDEDVYAVEPLQAITPGELSILTFDLPFDYLPGEFILYDVNPIANHLLAIEFTEMFENTLSVGVYLEPNHWSGKIYFQISIFIDADHYQYRGIHFVSQNPVPPVDFECPFNVVVDGTHVFVEWNGLHTYPFDDRPLRSTLSVNGNRFYKVKPAADASPGYFGDYKITLDPGIHELTLFVDDYQVNRASFTMDVVIDEPPPPVPYFALAPDGKSNPEPWYRWISGLEGVTPVSFYTNLPDDEITEVRFFYAYDPAIDWVLFWTDIDGTSNSAPGEPGSESDDHDGWCGYLHHEMLGMIPSEVFFKAEVETSNGIVHEILSETSLYYTQTPPNAFLITTSEGHVIENEYVTDQDQLILNFSPLHDRFEYVQFQHSDLPKDYDKETPLITQPNDYYCGPASLAMCLKYFAKESSEQWGNITGGLSDEALMDSLANRCKTVNPRGTSNKGMVSGAAGWIDKQGGGFKVEKFKKFSEFGKDKFLQHLLMDKKKNGVSQNIISRFMLITNDDDTLYHYMTLSSIHDKGAGYHRFNFADPMQLPPPEGGKLKFDLDDEGNASNITWENGEEIHDFDTKKIKLLESMMICPNEPAIVSEEGEISEGPEFPPVEVETPEGSTTGTRVRAVDQDGNKYETDIIVRRPPKTVCPDSFTLPLGGAPHKLEECTPGGGIYSGPHVDDGWFHPDFPGEFIITYTLDFYGYQISTDFIIAVAGYDFGDAPDDPYPTLLANNGARHLIGPDLYLGQLVDAEMDGQPCPFALGDDQDGIDDEDGIRFLNSFLPGETVTIEATVHGTGYLNAWFDWEANGSWHDPGNHTIVNQPVTSGIHTFDITVPDYAATGFTFTRFRLTSQSGLSFAGSAPDGEVEDYRIRIFEPVEHKMHFPQYPDPAGWDVNITNPQKIGDDWMCSETGYVENFHFWVSWKNDHQPLPGVTFIVEIYSDLPALLSPTGYSMPDNLLWVRDFAPDMYNYQLEFIHPQGWFDPYANYHNVWDHQNCYKINIDNISDPFLQEAGEIYWLVISAQVPPFKGGDEEVIILSLQNIDPQTQPYDVWNEQGFDLSIQDHPFAPDLGFTLPPDGGVGLSPALLLAKPVDVNYTNADLLSHIEIDIIEFDAPGSTVAELYLDDELVGLVESTQMGAHTLVIEKPMPDKGKQLVPVTFSVSVYGHNVLVAQLRLTYSMVNYQIGWKTSSDHFMDVAVWESPDPAIKWELLLDPITQNDLSLAFVINGTPVPPTFDLIVVASPDYAGTVSGAGSYMAGEIVQLTAVAQEGWTFDNWMDDEGNVISIIDIFDYTMPAHDIILTANFTPASFVVYCPDDVTVDNDPGVCNATNVDLGEPSIEESFEIVEMFNNAPDEFPVGTTIVTWTLINEFGVTSTCEQLIDVIDVEPPEMEDIDDIGVVAAPGTSGANAYWDTPEITDNCAVASVEASHNSGNLFPIGETMVTYTATDPSGNQAQISFTVTVKASTIPAFVELDGLTISEDDGSQCFEAAIAIYMMNSTVESGADVNLVAGEYIKILAGTHIKHGAQFVARIDLHGTFCDDTKSMPAPEELDVITEAKDRVSQKDLFFKVYPNPTEGEFTLELLTYDEVENLHIEIFTLQGTRVISKQLPQGGHHVLDLTGYPPGMYVVRVIMNGQVGFERLIKR